MIKISAIIIATHNPSKKKRYSRILSRMTDQVLGLDEFEFTDKPVESGQTAEANAQIKAGFYTAKTNLPCFAIDEALYADFLNPHEQPGVHVRRINGQDEVDDDALLKHWEQIIVKVPQEKRTGHWHVACCLAFPDRKNKIVAVDYDVLFFSPSSKTKWLGWPLSSLEGPVKFDKPHSELSGQEKEEYYIDKDNLILEKLKNI